jgi:hypothetical protein
VEEAQVTLRPLLFLPPSNYTENFINMDSLSIHGDTNGQ